MSEYQKRPKALSLVEGSLVLITILVGLISVPISRWSLGMGSCFVILAGYGLYRIWEGINGSRNTED